MGVTPPSAWPWLDLSVSGLMPATQRPYQTRFRCAYTSRLKLAANTNSRTHYTKGTPSPLRAPTVCKRSVSGLFHSPCRGAFHLSLTVLVHYRSPGSIQAWRVVPPCSDRVSRAPPYSRISASATSTGLTPSLAGLSMPFDFSRRNHWPDPRSLATTSGISVDVFSSRY